MDFEQVEGKIIAELKLKVTYLRTVETYAGQLEGDIKNLPVKFPAAFVVYGGSEFKPVDGPNHREQAEFTVIVCAKNLRGGEKARKDAHGAYAMVKDVLAALTNRDFGLDLERLRPVRAALVFAGVGIAVYGVDFQTGFDTAFSW